MGRFKAFQVQRHPYVWGIFVRHQLHQGIAIFADFASKVIGIPHLFCDERTIFHIFLCNSSRWVVSRGRGSFPKIRIFKLGFVERLDFLLKIANINPDLE